MQHCAVTPYKRSRAGCWSSYHSWVPALLENGDKSLGEDEHACGDEEKLKPPLENESPSFWGSRLTHGVGGKVLLQSLSIHLSLVHHTASIIYLPWKTKSTTPSEREMWEWAKTYQHIQGWMLFLERFCKLPDVPSLWHVHNVDVHLLQQTN